MCLERGQLSEEAQTISRPTRGPTITPLLKPARAKGTRRRLCTCWTIIAVRLLCCVRPPDCNAQCACCLEQCTAMSCVHAPGRVCGNDTQRCHICYTCLQAQLITRGGCVRSMQSSHVEQTCKFHKLMHVLLPLWRVDPHSADTTAQDL